MSSIDADTTPAQGAGSEPGLDLGQLMASALALSETDAAIQAVVNPPSACPGCLAGASIPWPDGTTSQFCRACADRMRRIHQCARWNANREHQSTAGKARWVVAFARWWAATGSAPVTIEAAQKYVTPDYIRGPGRLELSPELRDEIYRAWCAGYLLPVAAWFSDEPPPNPDGLWTALGAHPTRAQRVLSAGSPDTPDSSTTA